MALVTLPEVKEQLNIPGTQHDAELQGYIDAITEVVEDYKGLAVELLPRTEILNVETALILKWTPVESLTSVIRVDGSQTWDVSDLYPDPQSGEVHVLDGEPVTGLIQVDYEAGMDPVPERYIRGGLVIIQHNWETQRGAPGGVPRGVIPSGVVGPEEITPRVNYAIPRKAIEWLGDSAKAVL